jgi:hypothetical protein
VIHGFDIVAVGVEQEGGDGTVLPLAGRTIVAAAGGEARFVKPSHGFLVASLKCQVDMRRDPTPAGERDRSTGRRGSRASGIGVPY